MAKNLKLNIKNTQLAKALKLEEPKKEALKETSEAEAVRSADPDKKRVRARARSAFAIDAPSSTDEAPPQEIVEDQEVQEIQARQEEEKEQAPPPPSPAKQEPIQELPKTVLTPRTKVTVKKANVPPPPPPPAPAPAPAAALEKTPPAPAKEEKKKEFRDIRPKPMAPPRPFDSRDRYGLRAQDEVSWRRRRPKKGRSNLVADVTIRPKELSVRLPISIKDLAIQMKLKSSQLIQRLFLQGMILTLNDLLEDETTVQLLGEEFGCAISIDTSEEERIRITGKSIREEIKATDPSRLIPRAPVVAFMGHVDHGKTSLIDRIRHSKIAAGEAGAITQHIGAFRCMTASGPITILDTPGHEAFTAMRARGADVTDVVILVVAGDEGIKTQTLEAVQHARAAGVTILVAINKCDKPGFNADQVYRQLAEQDLLPEAWGGTTVTVNCSAHTGEGVVSLLEMIALQSDILELKADPSVRARGSVLESQMHRGLGAVATILVQNGTLRHGDPIVFDELWGRVKTMRDENDNEIFDAPPSTPVRITGLSGIPAAGSEFIVVKDEKEARNIAEVRATDLRERRMQNKRRFSPEALLQQATASDKKILNLILRADVQGSVEALRTSLEKIRSDKAEHRVIFEGVGAITESDVELAMASRAVIIGFHTNVESNADSLVKQHKVVVRLHDIIYHAVDDVAALLAGQLDKIAEEHDTGAAVVRAVFKSSSIGRIAGCFITEGLINRNHLIRLKRGDEVVWKGSIASLRREKEDVREVKAGLECGIVLNGYTDLKEGDTLIAFEVIYREQEL
ncbi:MAG: translation initiation factor IF-2 [Verrucomicrobia bacterium]|nr:translation initiation factor IF-2 [Verrucomicrobiota bacterium]